MAANRSGANQGSESRGKQHPAAQAAVVGIDVGGTFTDFVLWQAGALRIHKTPTTPDDHASGILHGLAALGLLDTAASAAGDLDIVHGMTVATNALLERRGAKTALLTSAGFGDVLVIGRQNRPHLYRLHQERPTPLAANGCRFEIAERLDATGAVLVALDEAALPDIATQLAATGVESLAIVFLFSYRNPTHERQASARLAELLPGLPLSLSSDILPEYREYERTATTVLNAYVQPLVARYLERLERALGTAEDTADGAGARRSLRIMQSNGGVIGVRQAAAQAARVVLSGPAGGAVGAFAVARAALAAANEPVCNILTFDMGGTSTDVCLCPNRVPATGESMVAGLPLRLPVIDIHTVGAGGGSLALVDAGGALQVGPQSAGAQPGPACYGRGGNRATVTDANLVLGRLDPAGFLGGSGEVQLDVSAARQVLGELAADLKLGGATAVEQAAMGVIRVANATMEQALRAVSIEQGYDPRGFTLVPFGGAGPLHACELAEALGMRRILCPAIPGVLSAFGMLAADVTADATQSVLSPVDDLLTDASALDRLAAHAAILSRRAGSQLAAGPGATVSETAALDLRYRGQSYELTVPLALPITAAAMADAVAAFHAAHAQRYGYAMPAPVEAVTLRVRAALPGAGVHLPRLPALTAPSPAIPLGERPVWFGAAGPLLTPIFVRDQLVPGSRIAGPALVLQYDSTLLIGPHWQGRLDAFGNLWCEFAGE